MKTIAKFVQTGITNLADLQTALQLAMQLEFATIPPYLCVQWSIDSSNDPCNVADMIQTIVVEATLDRSKQFGLEWSFAHQIGSGPSTRRHCFGGWPASIASSSRKMMRRSSAIPASDAPSCSRVRSWTVPCPRTAA